MQIILYRTVRFFMLLTLLVISGCTLISDIGHETASIGPTGEVVSKLLVTAVWPATCNMTFVEGYNLVSTYCIPTNATVQAVFVDLLQNLTSIHAYEADSADPWKAYNPTLPSWVVQDLTQISRERGYWVLVDSDSFISVNGTYRLPVLMDEFIGWNLVSYPADVPIAVLDQLTGIDGKFSLILMYNASDSSDPWKRYDPLVDPSFNDLSSFHPLYGYWINMTENATWYVDT